MNQSQFDVVIIGAGASGLMAALEVSLTGRSVAVVEANERPGGRIRSVFTKTGYPIELGAEFIHGKLPLTNELLKKAGARKVQVKGSIWQHKARHLFQKADFIEDYGVLEEKLKKVDADLPVADFLNIHFNEEKFDALRSSLKNYVEGYYAADIHRASTFALREELLNGDEEQPRIVGGYQKLVAFLEERCIASGVQFYFSREVVQVNWKENSVNVMTKNESFHGKKAIVTVSIGVLQADTISFSPALPEKKEAVMKLGFGNVVKINLLFEDAFWKKESLAHAKSLDDLNFLFSEEQIPTWWTQYPQNAALLSGWLGGPKAVALESLSNEEVTSKAIHSLSKIFNLNTKSLQQKLITSEFHNWTDDPHFRGAYSYEVCNGEEFMKQVLAPVEKTVFFAGEGLHHGRDIGTVEAALQSGRSVAREAIAAF